MTHPVRRIDCDAGRSLGCQTFCCKLLVRLDPDQVQLTADGDRKSCLDKDPNDGYCVHLQRGTWRCAIFEARPSTCQGYSCNRDPMLQTVLVSGTTSLRALVTRRVMTPRERWVRVPESED